MRLSHFPSARTTFASRNYPDQRSLQSAGPHPKIGLRPLAPAWWSHTLSPRSRHVTASSSADLSAENHIAVAEIVAERARRLVECGKHAIIFLDSITRMARAYNHMQKGGGKILSGGIDARTMEKPRRFFGAARNAEGGGSLTIIATALIDTGSRMDEIIFQEFKGTGNTEILLDRDLFNRRIFPCINIPLSGTRKEEKIYNPEELPKIVKLRRALAAVDKVQAMELVLGRLSKFPTNADFLKSF